MDLIMITTNKNKASEEIEKLSKKFHIEYGMYCIRGEDFQDSIRPAILRTF